MLRQFGQFSSSRTTRGRAAAWLAILLNFALVPCTMALESGDSEHDCCPPSIELQPAECCGIDDVCVDTRVKSEQPDDLASLPAAPAADERVVSAIPIDASPPPWPDDASPPIHLANCVFLK